MIGMAPIADYKAIYLGYITYALVILVYARWLRWLIGPKARRFGWFLLAAQLVLLTMHGWPIGPHEWWDYDSEYNIPVTFATFQVMAGSFLALVIASLSSLRPHWQRGYWALLALGLYVLGQDEFGILHGRFPILEELYLFGGILVALLSVVIWRSQDAVKRRYLNLIFTGLGVSVIGAEVLDKLEKTCWSDLSDILISCVRYHPLEESFEKLGAFFVVMALLGFTEHTIPSLKFRRTGWPLLVVFSIIAILQLGQIRALQGRMDFYYQFESNPFKHRLDTEFQNGYQLIGVSLRHTATFNKSMFHQFNIYGKVNSLIKSDFGYALHFVDQASEDVYTAHEHWSRRNANHWLPERIYREDQHIWVPDDVPLNRALWLVFSLWQQTEVDEFMVIFPSMPVLITRSAIHKSSYTNLSSPQNKASTYRKTHSTTISRMVSRYEERRFPTALTSGKHW